MNPCEKNQDPAIIRRAVSGALTHSPNDVLPVGTASFFVTNDHGSSTVIGRMLEDYLQLARSYVLYYANCKTKVKAILAKSLEPPALLYRQFREFYPELDANPR